MRATMWLFQSARRIPSPMYPPGPVVVFNSFTPAYYVQYFRDLAHLAATDGLSPDLIARIMANYATVPA
jgi:hypothetical protein